MMNIHDVNAAANVSNAFLLALAFATAMWKGSRWVARFIDTAQQHTRAMEKLSRELLALSRVTEENTHGLTQTTAITQQNTAAIDRVSNRVESLTTQVAVIDERVQHIERKTP